MEIQALARLKVHAPKQVLEARVVAELGKQSARWTLSRPCWVIPQSQLLRNTTHTSPHTMLLEELSRFSKGGKREDTWRNSNLPKNLYYA